MKFTFENVYENRIAFQEACKEAKACEEEYKKLIESDTQETFMKVVYKNFNWINDKIQNFEPKYEYAFNFFEGFARVLLNNKRGYIKTDSTYLVEPKFDFADNFHEGFARVLLDGEYYKLDTSGNLEEAK